MCIYKVYAFVNNNRYFFTSKLLLRQVKSVVNCGGTNNTVPSNSLSRYVHLQVQSLSWEVHQDQWTFLCHRQSYSFTFGVLQHCNSQSVLPLCCLMITVQYRQSSPSSQQNWLIWHSKVKATPLQAWTGPTSSRRLRLPDFKTIGTWMW